jgi:hypothetical protein
MKTLVYLLLGFVVSACNTNPQNNAKEPTKNNSTKAASAKTFDLATLNLNENLPELMASQGIKSDTKTESDQTLSGFLIFKSNDPKVLRFENAALSGGNGKNKNYVLFHYKEDNKALAFYELILFSQGQTDNLINLMGKVGTLIFKQTKPFKGAVELDEKGNEVKPENSERKTFRVWENKSNGLSYFLIEKGSGQNLNSRLVVLRRSEQSGKDWISYQLLDWYKNANSEPL